MSLPLGVAEPISISDNGDGIHTVTYTPVKDGPYTVCVKYADQEVPRRSVPPRGQTRTSLECPSVPSYIYI